MLPFMIIPVWTSLQKLDRWSNTRPIPSMHATAGLLRVVLPQAMPGILSGSLIVFGLSASAFAAPALLGGPALKMVATLVYDEFLTELNWPLGATIAIALLLANVAIMLTYNRVVERSYKRSWGNQYAKNGPIALGFNFLVIAFILAPLLIVCVVAFTPDTTLSIPTQNFSLRWFRAVFAHPDFLTAFSNSIWLAFASASIAAALAVPAAIAIVRYQFPGRDALNALFLSPLMIPHLVLGVALLRFFALLGMSGNFNWLILGHVVVITPYVLRLAGRAGRPG